MGNDSFPYSNSAVGNVTSLSLPAGTLVSGHDYAWNVSASNSAGTTYSAALYFQVQQQVTDTTPPTPNPSTWATAPYATGTTSISMTATAASDPSGVQYFFHNLTITGHDSGWQASSTYQDTGLSPNTTYTYQVTTRDLSPARNEGSYSTSVSAKTQQVSSQTATLVSKSVADHTVKTDGSLFIQTFTLRNTGTTPWVGYSLVHVAASDLLGLGTPGCSPISIPIPTTAAGATKTISVTLKASMTAGSGAVQLGYWQIQNGESVVSISGTSYLDPYAQNKLWTAITVNPTSGPKVPNLATSGYTSTISPYVAVGNGGQCVAFVWGRVYEALGITLRQADGSQWGMSAGQAWITAAQKAGFTVDMTPSANSIAVWQEGNGVGHVAYVENVAMTTGGAVTNVYLNEANCTSNGKFADLNDPQNNMAPNATHPWWGGGYDGSVKTVAPDAMKTRLKDPQTNTVYTFLGYIHLSMTLEAEKAKLVGCTVAASNPGYTGTGYVNYGSNGSYIEWSVKLASTANVRLDFRYANGNTSATGTGNRPLSIMVNGVSAGTLYFPTTASWSKWSTASISVPWSSGTSGIVTIRATAGSAGGPAIDSLTVGADKSAYNPNAALSGVQPTGASATTAKQYNLTTTGVSASDTMAAYDSTRVMAFKTMFEMAARLYDLPPALLAAIASRETHGGTILNASGWGLYDSNGYGLMQVDRSSSPITSDGPFSQAHINQAASILRNKLDIVQRKYPNLTLSQQLLTATSWYNGGQALPWPNSDNGTTDGDYGNDVMARAQYYAGVVGWIG
jgi:surface antigen